MTEILQDANHEELVNLIRNVERRLETASDLDPLLAAIGDAQKPRRFILYRLIQHRASRRRRIRGGYKEL